MGRLRGILSSSLVRNTFKMLLGHGGRIGLYGLYFVLSARILGAEGLGLFSAVLALVKIMQPFAGWGSDEVLVRRVAQNRDEYPEAFGEALLLTLVTGVVLTGVAAGINQLVFAGKVSWTLTVLIALSELVFYRLQLLVRRIFQAFERLTITAVVKAVPGAALLVAIIALKYTAEGSGYPSVDLWGWWYFIAMAIPSTVALVVTLILLKRPTFTLRAFFTRISEGFYFSLSVSAKTAYTDVDKILLLRLGSSEAAGIYKAAYRLVSVLMTPVLALLDAAYARFFRTGKSGVVGSYRFALQLLPATVLYGLVVGLGLFLAAPLLPLLLGAGFAKSVEVLRWIALIPVIQAASYMLMQTLTGGGHQRGRSALQLAVAAFNLAGNYLLISRYSWRASAVVAVLSELILTIAVFVMCRYLSRGDAGAEAATSQR